MKNLFQSILLVVVLFAAIFAGLYFKQWQCEQMFPNASLMACMTWSK